MGGYELDLSVEFQFDLSFSVDIFIEQRFAGKFKTSHSQTGEIQHKPTN